MITTSATFLGLEAAAWVAIATAVYAAGTLILAAVTARASKNSIENAAELNGQQNDVVLQAASIQARASAISNNRQSWINALRNEVTGFLTDAAMDSTVRDHMPVNDARAAEQFRISRTLKAHIFKVRLLINPTEGESTALVAMLEDARVEGLDEERQEKIVAHVQKILKTEWERVKSGE